MIKRIALACAVVPILAASVFTGCSSASPVSAAEAYDIGCPLVDATVAGGAVTNKAAVAGLKALRDSGQLAADPQRWLEATIAVLEAATPADIPPDVRAVVVDGCAANGHPLRNLTA